MNSKISLNGTNNNLFIYINIIIIHINNIINIIKLKIIIKI